MRFQISIFLFVSCCAYPDPDICYFRKGQPLSVTFHTNNTQIQSVVWTVKEYAEPIDIFNCSLSGCSAINSTLLSLSATVNLDSTQNSIVTSTLTAPLGDITNLNLTRFGRVICKTSNINYTLCRWMLIYINPENVTCTIDMLLTDSISISCTSYPSGRIDYLIINNKTFTTSSDDHDGVGSYCSYNYILNGKLYYTKICLINIKLNILGPGDNHISAMALPEVIDSDFKTIGKDLVLTLEDGPEELILKQPTYVKYWTGFKLVSLAPLPYKFVSCSFILRTNGNVIRSPGLGVDQNTYLMNRSKVNPFLIQCTFYGITKYVGVGHHEFQGILTTRNGEGKVITSYSNWTTPVIFYHPTEMNFTVNESSEGVEANIGTNITFQCTVDGFPPTNVSLSQDIMWVHGNTIVSLRDENFTLLINGCEDAGFYICAVQEGALAYQTDRINKALYVNVPCPLRLRSNRDSDSQIINLGSFFKRSNILIPVFGYPRPTSMTLYRSQYSNTTRITDGVQVVYTDEQGPYGNIEIIFNNNELIKHLTNYTLAVENGKGITFFDFSIQDNHRMVNSVMSIHGYATSICMWFVYIMSSFFL